MHSPYSKSGESCSTSLTVENIHKLFGIFLHRGFVYSHSYTYFIMSGVSMDTQIFILYTFVILHVLVGCPEKQNQ